MRANIIPTFLAGVLAFQAAPRVATAQSPSGIRPELSPVSISTPAPGPAKLTTLTEVRDTPGLTPAKPIDTDRTLPINLATALRLADARPLIIEAARAAVETEYGLYQQAKVLWLPTIDIGMDYLRHDGGQQNILTGASINGTRNQFFAGAGASAVFALTDAIYSPLAAAQLLHARNIDIQTAKNDALLSVATAYFDVQQARGILAGTLDSVAKARELARRVASLAKGLAAPIEVQRVNALLEDLEQQAAVARQDWRFTSATLTRVLRLNPGAVVIALEPPDLQVTMISPKEPVDALIPVGLTSRPELASQQAVVQATLMRLRQEQMRPLIPSLVLRSNSTPGQELGVGIFGSGSNSLNSWNGRSDWEAQVVWEFKNLGFGNRGLITQRRGEKRQALVELYSIQDQVAAEVAQAHALVMAAVVRVNRAEAGLKAAIASYKGNLKGLSQTVRLGEVLQLVIRPQEAVAAPQQLQQAYINYYTSTNDYNRAQFQLLRAMGYPAQTLACSGTFGAVKPVDTSRPPQMAPVHAPEPCNNCPR